MGSTGQASLVHHGERETGEPIVVRGVGNAVVRDGRTHTDKNFVVVSGDERHPFRDSEPAFQKIEYHHQHRECFSDQ